MYAIRSYYDRNHTDQLPLDTLNLADIQETDVHIEDLVDDTFASLGLESDDFLAPEKSNDPAEIDHIRDLVAQKKFFTANKHLSALPETVLFPDREEIQQNISKIQRKTDQLFKLAEQLEEMAKFDEALEVTDNLLAMASDAPGAASLRERIQQSCQLALSSDLLHDREASVVDPVPPAPQPPRPQPHKTAKSSPVKLSGGIPLKPILFAMLILGLCIGTISLYFKDRITSYNVCYTKLLRCEPTRRYL